MGQVNEQAVVIRVHFAQGAVEEFRLDMEGDKSRWRWRIDEDRRFLVIRTSPGRHRTHIPLEVIRYFEVYTNGSGHSDDNVDAAPVVNEIFRTLDERGWKPPPPQGVPGVGLFPTKWVTPSGEVVEVGDRFVGYNFSFEGKDYEFCLITEQDKVGYVLFTEPELWPDQRFVYGLLPVGNDGERKEGVLRGGGNERSEVRDEVPDPERTASWRPGDC